MKIKKFDEWLKDNGFSRGVLSPNYIDCKDIEKEILEENYNKYVERNKKD